VEGNPVDLAPTVRAFSQQEMVNPIETAEDRDVKTVREFLDDRRPNRKALKVLYVGETAVDAELAQRELSLIAPHIVLDVATSLPDAVCRVEGGGSGVAFDLILANLHASDGMAIGLVEHMRHHGIEIPLVVITGHEGAAVSALSAVADNYVVKRDGYVARLPTVIEQTVNRHRAFVTLTASPLRVLYAERTAAVAELTRRHFVEHAPFIRLSVAGSAEEVLHTLTPGARNAKDDYDVLLLDCILPDMNAIDLIKEVREDRGLDVPIVLVTEQDDEQTALRALKLGATDYIRKASGYLYRLPRAIENACHLSRLRRETEALAESELRYRTLFESAPVGIWTTDPTGCYTTANPAALRLWAQPALGRTDAEMLPQELSAARRAVEQRVMATGEDCSREEVIQTPLGLRTLLTRTIALRHISGTLAGTLSTGLDITEQKSLEAQLMQSQKMEAIGRLAGGVAHDFNNLLTIIGGYADLLSRNKYPAAGEDHDSIEEIQRAVTQAAGLTRQLLVFSRRQVLQFEALDLNILVADLAKMLQRLIGEDVKLVTALAPAAEHVLADAVQIDQVLVNLAVNARDAMPAGGTLTIETANVLVEEGAAPGNSNIPPGRYVRLSVSDTGFGMDRETLSHIFEPFFTTKGVGKGTGLGLSTVYGIVRQSRGHFMVWSEPGRGTVFEVYFPATQPQETAVAPVKFHTLLDTGIILLLEDERAVRKLAAAVLREGGFTVMEAEAGTEALSISEQISLPIRLLITDIVLPGIGGPDVAAQLQGQRPAMKVLFISGYSDETIARQGIPSSASFLAKPFSPEVLLAKVREVLGASGPG
jgi:PAS domain S-box-containing protein